MNYLTKKEFEMKKRTLLLVMFMLITVLALSAFRWAPDHLGIAVYYQSERADYSALYVTQPGVNQRSIDAYAARYTAMAKYYQNQNADYSALYVTQPGVNQRSIDAYAARYTAMAKYYQNQNADFADSFTTQQGMDIYHQSEWNSSPVQGMSFHYTAPGR
jgi:hypothetical protein